MPRAEPSPETSAEPRAESSLEPRAESSPEPGDPSSPGPRAEPRSSSGTDRSSRSARARSRPPGRRPGDSGTRAAILDAAGRLFAELGFDGASVRAIAAAAGVDPGLIRHFYGDKEGLFVTVLATSSVIPERLAAAFAGPREGRGARIAAAYLGLWESPETRPALLALVRSASTSPRASAMLRDVLGARVLAGASPDAALGYTLAGTHLLGVAVGRHVVRVEPLATAPLEDLVTAVAPVIQSYVTR